LLKLGAILVQAPQPLKVFDIAFELAHGQFALHAGHIDVDRQLRQFAKTACINHSAGGNRTLRRRWRQLAGFRWKLARSALADTCQALS
jgi:post-segregation antitoxin (ccd killing protein)